MSLLHASAAAMTADPMLPQPFRVTAIRRDLADTFTLTLVPEGGGGFGFAPGQFNMLYLFGTGEVPISISGDPADETRLVHTVRAVGAVTRAMAGLAPGDAIGLRGPFGTPWPVAAAFGNDLVIVAGGVGLAPLRPAIYQALANRRRFGKMAILYGARTPEDILFRRELEKWRGRFDLDVQVTVDRATGAWAGGVGVVTNLIARAGFDPMHTTALVCGPEIMMRYAVMALEQRGVGRETIFVSMERSMKCGIGLCGHCQWGPHFVCKDGPVFAYDRVAELFAVREV